MNFFMKNSVVTWILGGLLVVSLSVLGTMIYHQLREPATPAAEKECGMRCNLLAEELKLSPSQEEKVEQVRAAHRASAMVVADSMKVLRAELVTELSRAVPDTLHLRQLAQGIGALQARLTDLLIDQYLAIRKECTPEQQEKLSSLYYEIMGCCAAGEGMQMRERCGRK